MIERLTKLWQNLLKFGGTNGGGLKKVDSIAAAEGSVKAKRQHDWIMFGALGLVLVLVMIWMSYQNKTQEQGRSEQQAESVKVEVASAALDSEKMWRNYFEDKLIEQSAKAESKLEQVESGINEQSIAYQTQLKAEIEKLKSQIQYLNDEQIVSKRDLSTIRLKAEADAEESQNHRMQAQNIDSRITVNHLDRGAIFDRPKSSRNFIPETAYVKGVLLGGIAVSTSMGSSSEPVPVIIRITDKGNLPKNFNIDLKKCRIMGSSYGDLSLERAIVRAEILSCQDHEKELIYTTKIAGIIFGDDGMNGIKGRIVQTSSKHLKNAMIGGVISGFANSAKGQDAMVISGFGVASSKKKGVADMAKAGGLAGAGNAAEKIAEYYIKQAEAMSPVLLVPGGVSVDIVFTKGVYLGALDVQEQLDQVRRERVKK